MILITGATGTVGSEVITELLPAEADPASALAQMVSYGMPEELAHAVIEPFRSTVKPYNCEPTGDITAVTARPARSFADWAQAHRTELLAPEAVQNAATIEESR